MFLSKNSNSSVAPTISYPFRGGFCVVGGCSVATGAGWIGCTIRLYNQLNDGGASECWSFYTNEGEYFGQNESNREIALPLRLMLVDWQSTDDDHQAQHTYGHRREHALVVQLDHPHLSSHSRNANICQIFIMTLLYENI
jgi:hypothetical protein